MMDLLEIRKTPRPSNLPEQLGGRDNFRGRAPARPAAPIRAQSIQSRLRAADFRARLFYSLDDPVQADSAHGFPCSWLLHDRLIFAAAPPKKSGDDSGRK